MKAHNNPAFLNIEEIQVKTSSETAAFAKLQQSQNKKVLIIGAGPSGLAAGITLRAKGWDVVILEKRKTYSRSNVIGINKAALGWFQQYNLLDKLSAISSKTASFTYGEQFPVETNLLKETLWLNAEAKTAQTVSIKSLQQMLSEHFLDMGGDLINVSKVKLLDEAISIATVNNELSLNTQNVDLVIAADGAYSETKVTLEKLVASQTKECDIIPNETFANIIISPKPQELKNGIYFANSPTGKILAAISVSDHDAQVNFQTNRIENESDQERVLRLIRESKNLMLKIAKELPEDATYYPIHGGKVSLGFKNGVPANLQMNHILVETPTRVAEQTTFNNKFVLIGDAKGISSPKAGLGASLAIAYDTTIIGQLAETMDFSNAEASLKRSIGIWVAKTMEKHGLQTQKQQYCMKLFDRPINQPTFSGATLKNVA